MKPMTMAQKVLARCSGNLNVEPGNVVWAVPDKVIWYDWPQHTSAWAKTISELRPGQLKLADRTTLFIDHFVPSNSSQNTYEHEFDKKWAKEQGYSVSEGEGIGHQVSAEKGLVKPGEFVVHIDTHVHILGALGALPFGLNVDIYTTLMLGKIWMRVPETIQIELTGAFRPGADGRDLIHKIIQDHGGGWAHDCCIEFIGPGARNMSIDQRMNTMVMLCFTGALTGTFPCDSVTENYFAMRGIACDKDVYTDEGAVIKEKASYDLSEIEPMIVTPGCPSNAVPIQQVIGTHIDQCLLGTCASGRLEDLEVAANILKGHKIKDELKLYILPSSNEVFSKAAKAGYIKTFIDAGAYVSAGSCDCCFGNTQCLMEGQTALSTGTLNTPGRMGSVDAEIYLSSAATIAISSIYGQITDPRNVLQKGGVADGTNLCW